MCITSSGTRVLLGIEDSVRILPSFDFRSLFHIVSPLAQRWDYSVNILQSKNIWASLRKQRIHEMYFELNFEQFEMQARMKRYADAPDGICLLLN